jgi:hypothetical protein
MMTFGTHIRGAGRRALLAPCLGLASIAALAPPAPATEQPTILVQGERLPPEAARERAVAFVRTTGVASGQTPAARWVDPICPDVVGLVETAERAAEARIRRIAAAVGARVAPEGCTRNIVVSFASDGAALAREIARRDPARLAQLSASAREAVLTGSAPIRWWYTTEVRSRHNVQGGDGMSNAGGTDQTSPGSGYGAALGGNGGGLMHYESSIVSTLTSRVLTSAIVVVDLDKVMGRRLDALAAYAALVALAEIRGVGAAPEGSILGLFAAPVPARDLTAQDMAFLRALYRLPLDRQAMQHRGFLVGEIADALAGGEP